MNFKVQLKVNKLYMCFALLIFSLGKRVQNGLSGFGKDDQIHKLKKSYNKL